jgi:hypothetical protein
MAEAALHPRRIAVALGNLERVLDNDEDYAGLFSTETLESCKAALKVLQKTQQRCGLTPEFADLVTHTFGVLDYVKSGFTRK